MLNLRPYRKNDSQKIVTWAQDENTFYKWSEGRLGNLPVSAERLEQAVSGRIDIDIPNKACQIKKNMI